MVPADLAPSCPSLSRLSHIKIISELIRNGRSPCRHQGPTYMETRS